MGKETRISPEEKKMCEAMKHDKGFQKIIEEACKEEIRDEQLPPEELCIVPLHDHDHYLYTYDLGASAALITAGFELFWVDKYNPRKVQFIFKKKNGIGQALEAYWSNKLEVKARSYFDNTKMLKTRLYS